MRAIRWPRRQIIITPEVLRLYRNSMARHAPETVALLGGPKHVPFLVTEFRFLPPRRNGNGGFDASSVHVNVDHDLMNWIVDNEWRPAGNEIRGVWHSHPGNLDTPSRGDVQTNEGDEAFFAACLAKDDSPDRSWRWFLAPITTFASDGTDRVHGWLMRRGRRRAERCDVVVSEQAASPGYGAGPMRCATVRCGAAPCGACCCDDKGGLLSIERGAPR